MQKKQSIKISIFVFFILVSLISCRQEPNRIRLTMNTPIKDAIFDKNNLVVIDFDIEASIRLNGFHVIIWINDSIQYSAVPSFDPMPVVTTNNSYHFREVVDLSSYPSGTSFGLQIISNLGRDERNNDRTFVESMTFTII